LTFGFHLKFDIWTLKFLKTFSHYNLALLAPHQFSQLKATSPQKKHFLTFAKIGAGRDRARLNGKIHKIN